MRMIAVREQNQNRNFVIMVCLSRSKVKRASLELRMSNFDHRVTLTSLGSFVFDFSGADALIRILSKCAIQ